MARHRGEERGAVANSRQPLSLTFGRGLGQQRRVPLPLPVPGGARRAYGEGDDGG